MTDELREKLEAADNAHAFTWASGEGLYRCTCGWDGADTDEHLYDHLAEAAKAHYEPEIERLTDRHREEMAEMWAERNGVINAVTDALLKAAAERDVARARVAELEADRG